MDIYGYIRLYVDIYGYIWIYTAIYYYIYTVNLGGILFFAPSSR